MTAATATPSINRLSLLARHIELARIGAWGFDPSSTAFGIAALYMQAGVPCIKTWVLRPMAPKAGLMSRWDEIIVQARRLGAAEDGLRGRRMVAGVEVYDGRPTPAISMACYGALQPIAAALGVRRLKGPFRADRARTEMFGHRMSKADTQDAICARFGRRLTDHETDAIVMAYVAAASTLGGRPSEG